MEDSGSCRDRGSFLVRGAKIYGQALTQIQHYNHIARVKLETAQAEYKKYVERHTPEEIRIANNARKELNRKFPTKYGKQVKYPEIQDERVVTRPRNSYIQFASIRATSGDFKNIMAKDRMKLLGQEWKELSAEEKQVRYSTAVQVQPFANLEMTEIRGAGQAGQPSLCCGVQRHLRS